MRRFYLLLLPLLGCATIKSLTVGRPTLTFEQARIDRVDFDGADVTLIYQVQNPNAGGITLSNVAYVFDVDGHTLVAGQPPNGFHIPPGNSELPFPVRLVWTQVLPALQALATQDSVHYKASGTAGVDTPLGPLTLDLTHEGTIPTPKLPQISIDPPRLTSISPLGARLSIPLRVANKNAFPLPLAGVTGEVRISGESVGRLLLPAQGVIPANQEQVVEVPLDISFLSAGLAVAKALQAGQAEIAIEGALAVGTSNLPVHVSQTVQVQRQ
jgi:LEA14-like dessication related protein